MAINFLKKNQQNLQDRIYQAVVDNYVRTGNAGGTQKTGQGVDVDKLAQEIWKRRSPLAGQQLSAWEAYKDAGNQGLSPRAVKNLTSKSFYTPSSLQEYDAQASYKALLDQIQYISMHRNEGLWDVEGNMPSAWSDSYLQEVLTGLPGKISESLAADEQYRMQQETTSQQNKSAQQQADLWRRFFMEAGDGTTSLSNMLYAKSLQDGMPAMSEEEFNAMPDEEWIPAYEELEKWYEALDREALMTPAEAELPQYQSQTEQLRLLQEAAQAEADQRRATDVYRVLAEQKGSAIDLASLYAQEIEGYDPEVHNPEYAANQLYFINQGIANAQLGNVRSALAGRNAFAFLTDDEIRAVNSYEERGYNYLTAEELAVYNSLYAMGGDVAQRYLDALGPDLLERRRTILAMESGLIATDSLPLSILSTAAGFAAPIANLGYLGEQAAAAAKGTADPNAAYYDIMNAQSDIRGAQREELAEKDPTGILPFLYDAATSVGDVGIGIALDAAMGGAGRVNQALMGSRAATGTMQESAARDIQGMEALLRAGGSAAIEALTEKLGFNPGTEGAEGVMKTWLRDTLGEAAEEGLANIGNTLMDVGASAATGRKNALQEAADAYTLAGEENPWGKVALDKAKELGTDMLMGGIAGGVLGAGRAASSYSDRRSLGKQIKSEGDPEKLLEIARNMPEDSESRRIAETIDPSLARKSRLKDTSRIFKDEASEEKTQAKGKKDTAKTSTKSTKTAPEGKGKKNVSFYQLGRLTRALEADLHEEHSTAVNAVMDRAIEARLVELGSTPEAAKRNAVAVRKVYRGQELTVAERAAVNWNSEASQAVKELAAEVKAGDEGRTGKSWVAKTNVERIAVDMAAVYKQDKLAEAVETKAAADVAEAVENAGKKVSDKNAREKNLTVKEVAYATEGGEVRGEFQRFVKQGGKLKAIVKSGDDEVTVAVEDLTDEGGAGTATIIEYTALAHHDMSEEEANALMTTYQRTGGNARKFITDFEAVYAAGFAGINAPETNLPEGVAQEVFKQAMKEGAAAEEERVEKAKRLRESVRGSVAWLGEVEDNAAIRGAGDQEALSDALEGMTESQRTTVEVVQAMAEELRVNIVLYQSTGKNIDKTANGKYDGGTHTLYIDVNSGAASAEGIQQGKATSSLGYAMMRTLGHELTHHIEATSADGYARYKTAVKQQLKEAGESWAALVRAKIDSAAAEGRKLTRMGAEAEVIADASEYMLQESSFTKKLDSSLRAKVKTFVQSFMAKVKEIFTHITGEHRESAALRKVIDGVRQYTGNLQALWDAALGESLGGVAREAVAAPVVTETAAEEAVEERRDEGKSRMKPAIPDYLLEQVAAEDAQYSMRDAYGNEFVVSEKEIEDNKRAVANMQPIIRIVGNQFAKKEGKDFKTMALEYFGEEGTTAQSELLGPVAIDKAGIEHLISALTWRRSALLPAIKPVIENGRIIQVEKNHKGYGFDTALIAGVVNLDGKDYYMGVAVRERNDGSNGYYIHDAVMAEKRSPLPNKSGLVTAGEKAPTLAIILKDLANYNTQFAEEEQFSTRDRTESAAFQRWFKGSRVVNGDGSPKVMYHGTRADEEFTVFNTFGGNFGLFGVGSYFTDDREVAEGYTRKGRGSNPRVYEVYLSIKNPLDMDAAYDPSIWQGDDAYLNRMFEGSATNEEAFRRLKEYCEDEGMERGEAEEFITEFILDRGFDGIRHTGGGRYNKGDTNRHEVYIAFEPEQIKSATDNVGTFDPENPDIRYSTRDLTETEQFEQWFGNSEVIDRNGLPLVVYHTTRQRFTIFDKRRLGEATDTNASDAYLAATAHVGFWFNTAPLDKHGLGRNVMPVYLSAQQVYEVGTLDALTEEIWNTYGEQGFEYDPEEPTIEQAREAGESYRQWLESQGYDGIVLDDTEFGGKSYVVFEPEQIKSATDNVGTFDPENPDIRYSTRDLPDTVSIREYLGAMKPTSRMTETEKELLIRYQKKLAELQEKERLAAEQDAILKEAHGDELLKAKNRYKVYRQQANRIAKELARMERAEGFANIMATSQTIVNKYLDGTTGSVADAQEALETEIKGLTNRLKVISSTVEGTAQGQRAAFSRGLFNQAELNRAAKHLRDSYNSRMSIKEVADRLALAYGEIYANDGAEGAKRFTEAARELAQDILDSSRYRYRSETLSIIAEEVPTISLSDTDKAEIRNAGLTLTEYKRMLSPYVRVADGASDLSSYVSNAAAYGGQLASILGTDTEGDLAMALYNVIQAERAAEQSSTFEGMSESESLGMVMADVASVTLPMSTSDTTLEYLRKELKKYAGENEGIARSVDEAIQAAKAATWRASAVWRRAVKAQDVARQAVEYYRALEEQRRLIELQEQKETITEQLRSEAAKKLEEKVEARRQEYREREQKARAYRQTRDEVNKLRRSIGRKVKRLNTLRIRETDQKHVPQELQHVADLVMQTFTDSSLSKLAFAPQQTASLARRYRQLQELESDMTYYWDDEIETDIENLQALSEAYTALTTKEDGSPARYHSLEGVELETEILQGVDSIVSNVMHMIDAGNDQFLTQRNETFNDYATQVGKDLLKRDNAKVLKGKFGDAQMALDEMFRTGNLTPVYFFEQLQNGRIKEVYDEIRRGQTQYAYIVKECQDFVQEAKRKHHYGRWVGDEKLTMQTSKKHKITLSREQAMWVYATAKRETSNKLYQTEHLLHGGFQYKDTSSTGEGVFRGDDKPHPLDAADVAKIENWLTAEQKAYADEVVGFLSTTMADYGNAASMEMFGYKKFLESYYFPFQTAAAQRFQRGDEGASGESAGTGRVKNSGFTKKLQHKANTTLVMDDFTTVAVDHMQKMATYAAMVQPIENMKRLMNHKVIEDDGTIQTIRALIGQKYGKAQQAYLQDFLKDLNGAAQGDNRATKGVDYLIGAFKRGAVMASLSVVLQQPTAMARAMAMVNPKYFVTNPFYRPSKGVWDKMMKHSGTAIIKDMGKFDVGLGLTASEYISDEHLKPWEAYRRLKAESKLKGGAAFYKRFMDWLTAAPGKADQWTWGLIWQAVEKEVAAQNPGMDTSSEAFLDLVGKRFDDVIDHTQVYDSVLTRSNLMRSKHALHKMATSFMAEPTMSINMLYNALTGKHSGKKRAAIIGSVIASQVLAGAMAALVQAWNDDKDERNWLEKYADRAAGNILDNINVFGMVPYISDFISLLQGYEVERADMSVLSTLIKYTTGFWNKLSNGETLTLKDWENFAGNWANLTGVPAKNIMREIRRTINAVTKTDWSAPNMSNVGYAMKENLGIFYSSKNTAYYERLTSAMLKGDKELAEDLRTYMLTSKMVTEDTLEEGLRGALKDEYQRGRLTKDQARDFLLDNNLAKNKQSAFTYVDKWDEEWEGDGNENYSHSVYNSVRQAIDGGSKAEITAAIKELTDNGWAEDSVAEAVRSYVKDSYIENRMTQSQVRNMYKSYCLPKNFDPEDENDWYWLFKELDYYKQNGADASDWEKYGAFYSATETGNNLKAVVQEYLNHGVEKKTLSGCITTHYKQQMIDLWDAGKRTEYANLQARILTAYQALGYDRDKKLKDIQKWLEE